MCQAGAPAGSNPTARPTNAGGAFANGVPSMPGQSGAVAGVNPTQNPSATPNTSLSPGGPWSYNKAGQGLDQQGNPIPGSTAPAGTQGVGPGMQQPIAPQTAPGWTSQNQVTFADTQNGQTGVATGAPGANNYAATGMLHGSQPLQSVANPQAYAAMRAQQQAATQQLVDSRHRAGGALSPGVMPPPVVSTGGIDQYQGGGMGNGQFGRPPGVTGDSFGNMGGVGSATVPGVTHGDPFMGAALRGGRMPVNPTGSPRDQVAQALLRRNR